MGVAAVSLASGRLKLKSAGFHERAPVWMRVTIYFLPQINEDTFLIHYFPQTISSLHRILIEVETAYNTNFSKI